MHLMKKIISRKQVRELLKGIQKGNIQMNFCNKYGRECKSCILSINLLQVSIDKPISYTSAEEHIFDGINISDLHKSLLDSCNSYFFPYHTDFMCMTMGYAYLNIEVLKLTEMMIFLELVKHIKRPYFFFERYIPQNYLSSRYLLFFTSPKNYPSSRY